MPSEVQRYSNVAEAEAKQQRRDNRFGGYSNQTNIRSKHSVETFRQTKISANKAET